MPIEIESNQKPEIINEAVNLSVLDYQ